MPGDLSLGSGSVTSSRSLPTLGPLFPHMETGGFHIVLHPMGYFNFFGRGWVMQKTQKVTECFGLKCELGHFTFKPEKGTSLFLFIFLPIFGMFLPSLIKILLDLVKLEKLPEKDLTVHHRKDLKLPPRV